MAASTTLITNAQTIFTTGPSAQTQANSLAASGVIMDYRGMTDQLRYQLGDVVRTVNLLVGNTDPNDPNLAILQSIQQSLT